jgi:uncharacterized membrane-anchored protein
MKLSIRNVIPLFVSFLMISTSSFAEDFYEAFEALDWQEGPKTQNILGIATIFLPEDYVALDIEETDKYLELSQNRATLDRNFFGPMDSSWDGYFNFNKIGYVKDDDDIDADDLLKQSKNDQKLANEYRREQGWSTLTILGWEYPPKYDSSNNRLEWAYLLLEDETNSELINYETRILGRNGVMDVVLVTTPENLSTAVKELKNNLSTFKFNPGEKYLEYKEGDRIAEFGLAALITGAAAAVATKKGLWAMLGALLIGAKKFAVAIIIALFAGIASIFRRKK